MKGKNFTRKALQQNKKKSVFCFRLQYSYIIRPKGLLKLPLQSKKKEYLCFETNVVRVLFFTAVLYTITPYRTRHSPSYNDHTCSRPMYSFVVIHIASRRWWGPSIRKGAQDLLCLHQETKVFSSNNLDIFGAPVRYIYSPVAAKAAMIGQRKGPGRFITSTLRLCRASELKQYQP